MTHCMINVNLIHKLDYDNVMLHLLNGHDEVQIMNTALFCGQCLMAERTLIQDLEGVDDQP